MSKEHNNLKPSLEILVDLLDIIKIGTSPKNDAHMEKVEGGPIMKSHKLNPNKSSIGVVLVILKQSIPSNSRYVIVSSEQSRNFKGLEL